MIYDRVCFIGTGHVGRVCLTILSKNCDKKKLLCLSVDKESFSVMEGYSKRLGIVFRRFDKCALKEFLMHLHEKTLIFSAFNSYIFPNDVVKRENIRIINFHVSYLPAYRGCNIPTWEIYNQEKYGGATWHVVDSEIDTGQIIVQKKVIIQDNDTALDLLMRSINVGIKLLREYVAKMLNCDYVLGEYKAPGRLYLTKCIPNDGWLDVSWTMDKAYAFLRAMDYGKWNIMPIPKIRLEGEVYGIEHYEVRPCTSQKEEMCFTIKNMCKTKELYCKLKVV